MTVALDVTLRRDAEAPGELCLTMLSKRQTAP
jgi:hypothetical protein